MKIVFVVSLSFLLSIIIYIPVSFAQDDGLDYSVAKLGYPDSGQGTTIGETLPDYIIGCGDVLEISIWKEEGLTKNVTVRPDGKASFPLIGEFQAANLTVKQLTDNISDAFRKYFPDPIVSVTVEELNSLQIHVIGRVKKPGQFPYNSTLTVVQALAMAEGLTPFAQKKKIFVLRQSNGHNITFNFNYADFVDGDNLEQNIQLERGDIVVVP